MKKYPDIWLLKLKLLPVRENDALSWAETITKRRRLRIAWSTSVHKQAVSAVVGQATHFFGFLLNPIIFVSRKKNILRLLEGEPVLLVVYSLAGRTTKKVKAQDYVGYSLPG